MTQTASNQGARAFVCLIAAVASNGVIGKDNQIPWRLSDDLKRFRNLTLGHPVIMGRRTRQSLGRPLPGRRNIVVSRDPNFRAEGCEVAASLQAALAACAGARKVFIIGGAQLYQEALPLADRLHLTEIDADFEGDVRFPAVDWNDWREAARETHHSEAGFDYAFATYERVGPGESRRTQPALTQSTK